eukprot:TRINITY_DN8935_c0_g1_i1.p1 TRINITY_DN8935_c0_g1~~TRINITY_DN8935_c0_g1_i1.p1  ORF type:complete len:514 (-),score=70.60 TRINITY_DN8935_c0_g1_i1:194-1528(-)
MIVVQPEERRWSAFPSLPQKISQALKVGQDDTVGILRPAFAPHDYKQKSLREIMSDLGNGSVAICSRFTDGKDRLVMDVYAWQEGTDGHQVNDIATDPADMLDTLEFEVCHVNDVGHVSKSNAAKGLQQGIRQSSNEVVMVAPTAFTFNEQAAQDNTFMHSAQGVTDKIISEFAELYRIVSDVAGVRVNLFQHHPDHGTPDAVFPNNWFSTHSAGEAQGGVEQDTMVLYPMKHPNRSKERRADIIQLVKQLGYEKVVDFSSEEKNGKYLEGTGALVLDRVNGVVYCALSERADEELTRKWADQVGYKDVVFFESTDQQGKLVYHTNVMMAVGSDVAVVCAESVDNPQERHNLLSKLSKTHEVIQISRKQMGKFCGNILELQDYRGLQVMAMSTQAYNAFTKEQLEILRKHVAQIYHAPIDTLESVGGGGVRCTLAEIFSTQYEE